jgi:hypothetical protein
MEAGRGASLLAVACVLLAGCAGVFGGATTETVTPASVPEPTATATPEATAPENGTVAQPRYFDLRPTCERPPGLVIAVQVGALANNGPADRGINTTWRFAAPSNREVTGPYPEFVRLIDRQFQPLLNAERVTYGRLVRTETAATQQVTVTTADNTTVTYTWTVERQSGGRYDGCWMTTGVSLDPLSRTG